MKNVKNRFLVLLTLLFTGSSLASATKQPDRIFVKGVCTEITFYSPTTVRILKYPDDFLLFSTLLRTTFCSFIHF